VGDTNEWEAWMSPTKKRQTMGKMARERELKERRVLKQEKKDERKAAAAEGNAETPDETLVDGEAGGGEGL
jgi:hypothetical protein